MKSVTNRCVFHGELILEECNMEVVGSIIIGGAGGGNTECRCCAE